MHPSESNLFLLTRILAFALNLQDGLAFSPGGLSDPDGPCISISDANGAVHMWIEVGSPSARKLHKAAKIATTVKVYTYKDAELLLDEMKSAKVYHADKIEVYSIAPEFLNRLALTLERDNKWTLVHTDGSLMLSMGDKSEMGEIKRHTLS